MTTAPPATIDLAGLCSSLTGWLAGQPAGKLPGCLLAEAWHGTRTQPGLGAPVLSWLLLDLLGRLIGLGDGPSCLQQLRDFGLDYAWLAGAASPAQEREIALALTLLQTAVLSPHPASSASAFAGLCNDPANAGLLGINSYNGTTWFVREGMATLAGAVALQAGIIPLVHRAATERDHGSDTAIAEILRQRLARAAAVGYRLDKFLDLG
jgi:hypothetical protein